MLGKYKNDSYIKLGTTTTIATVGELKEFIINNISLSDEELLEVVKLYMPFGTDINYVKPLMRTFKRKYKIEKLLRDEKTDI